MRRDSAPSGDTVWLDGFTRAALGIGLALLAVIFLLARYMVARGMDGAATDDAVMALASRLGRTAAHPFVALPGDTEVGAFSLASFFAGLIVGHHWQRLFGLQNQR